MPSPAPAPASLPEQSGPVVVYGATGYTGKLVAAELARRGADFVIAGRSREKLDALATTIGGNVTAAAVSLDDDAGLLSLLDGAGAVIACAGPFVKHGEAVAGAAAAVGTHYVDTTGEQPFMRSVFDRWGPVAQQNGAALVTGMGFDYLPGDLLAGLTAAGLGRVDEMSIAYCVRGFGPTRGTALSALGMMGADDVEWVDGTYRDGSRNVAAGSFDFPSPIGRRRVGRYPAGEQITVPRHVDVGTIREVIELASVTPPFLGPLAAPLMTGTAYLMETPLRGLTENLIGRLPEGPGEDARRAARFTIVIDASGPKGHRRGTVRGSDVYGLTAVTTVEGALRMAVPGYAMDGALAPAQAYDAAGFLDALAPHGIAYAVEELD
jgi:short subunit dehydrogenase-like uncharacterized protein